MTTCTAFENWNWQSSLGGGSVATRLEKIALKVRRDCIIAENMTTSNLPILKALEVLEAIYHECSDVKWDGYNAIPISEAVYRRSATLLNQLAENDTHLPMPEITPEPDGGIEFEWYNPTGPKFALSINDTDVFSYSGNFDDHNRIIGTETVSSEISPTIRANIQRIIK